MSLPGVPSVALDERDVGVALKLSREYDANELDCVALLVAANQEVGFPLTWPTAWGLGLAACLLWASE